MGLSRLTAGKQATLKSGSKLVPVVIVGEMPDLKLAWVRIGGHEVTVVDSRDLIRDDSGLVESKFTYPTG
jgi:hypothetical protein